MLYSPCCAPLQAEKGGEDAYCIVPAGLGAIGVADGVSGWAEEGIDPAEYSRTLMRCGVCVCVLGGRASALPSTRACS